MTRLKRWLLAVIIGIFTTCLPSACCNQPIPVGDHDVGFTSPVSVGGYMICQKQSQKDWFCRFIND